MSRPIQLLKQKTNGFVINTQEIFRILDKLSNINIASVSINGNKRTGKSFLLNLFLRYLRSNDPKRGDWIYGCGESRLNGFEWRCGAERTTVGIWIWSEPFIVKASDGSEVALLLIDTTGNFDEKTTFQECGVIFSLSALLSSKLILNMKNDLSEDKLQFVEFFTYFAESFSGETNLCEQLLQQLVFLVRDWENEVSYSYGCHDNDGPKTKNYKKDVIDPNRKQCNEAQHTRTQVLSYFNDVKSFLLPHPGLRITKKQFNEQIDSFENEFINYVKIFVPLVLENIEPKKIGGQTITGKSLKAYLSKWADIIENQKFPEAKTLATAAADVNHMLAFKHAMMIYDTKIRACFELKQTDNEFYNSHQNAEKESIQYFLSVPKLKINDQKKNDILNEIKSGIKQNFEVLRSNNCARIDKEETDRQIAQMNQELRKLNAEMMQQKLDYMVEMSEMDKKFTEDKLKAEKINSDNIALLLAEIRKPPAPTKLICNIL